MMRRLSMKKISEILRLRYELKLSHRAIGKSQSISASTVQDYLCRADACGITWPLPENITEEDLHNKLFSLAKEDVTPRPLPDWEIICRELRKKAMTIQLLWREYRDVHENGLSYSQFCNRYRDYIKKTNPVMRQVHKAGEKTFVDYAGLTMPWIDPTTGEIHEAQIFVGALGASQYIFTEATATQQLADWIHSHTRMWEYFGGVSEIAVPDNLKSGVTNAHRYDPDINANYQLFSEHYGFAIVPARVVEPKDKAKVENAVGCVERLILMPLRHLTFTSIAEINAAIKPRLTVLNAQPFQKMKTTRKELFETVDKPALKPLPAEKYAYCEWIKAKINIDYHFSYDDHYYSVHYQHIHKEVQVRATNKTVECFYQGKRLAVHIRSHVKYKHTTLGEHMPAAHAAHAEWTPERMKRWANKIGIHTEKFIEHMIHSRAFPQQAFRACLGVLRLGTRYGEQRLENACATGLTHGFTRYKQIENLLKNKLDDAQKLQANTQMTPIISVHENLRGAEYYKNLTTTKENPNVK
jgi:transposase